MNRFATLAAASVTGLMLVGSAVPAQAQSVGFSFGIGNADREIGDFCDDHPRSRDCRDWHDNRRYWDRDDYVSFSTRTGLSFGIIVEDDDDDDYRRGYALSDSHIDRCEARYRSYDAETDTFLGYDGERHYCNL
jgi:hypothetical protein